MELALGVLLLWLGVAGLYVAFHGTNSTTPWGIYQEILGQAGGGQTAGSAAPTDPAQNSTLANSTPAAGQNVGQ